MPVGIGNISMIEVQTEMATSPTTLTAMIARANSTGGWDATYSGSKNSLANFRGYNDTVACLTTTSLNFYATSASGSNIGACGLGSGESTKYFAPAGGDVNNGDTVYNDSGGCTPFNGGNQYYRIRTNGGGATFFSIRISTTGVVSSKLSC